MPGDPEDSRLPRYEGDGWEFSHANVFTHVDPNSPT